MTDVEAFERFVAGIREGIKTIPPAMEPPAANPLAKLWIAERDASARKFLQDMYVGGGIDAVPMAAQDASLAGVSARVILEELEKILEQVRRHGC